MNFSLEKYSPVDSAVGSGKKTEAKTPRFNHFDLMGDVPKDESGLISAGAEVSIVYQGEIQTMLFSDYLRFVGASYAEYQRAIRIRPGEDVNIVLRDLHREIVKKELVIADRLHQRNTRETAGGTNYQVETTKDHGQVFDRIINDLDISGLSSESAPNNVDYLKQSGIDHFLTIDPQALLAKKKNNSSEEAVGEKKQEFFFGLQRSFSLDKRAGILRDPVKILPSDNGKGVIFKVFLKESLFEYEDANKDTLMEKLDAIRRVEARKAGLSPVEYALLHERQGYPPVYKVLRNGRVEQVKRALRVLEEIKSQLNNYIASAEFQGQSEYIKKFLENMRDNLHLDEFMTEVQMVKDAK